MSTLGYILLFTFIGSVGALIGGIILVSRKKFALRIAHFLASFAAGTLLGTAFLDLLPEASHSAEELEINIFLWTLIGIIFFFTLERFIHWFHHHEEPHEHEREAKSILPLIVVGDIVHNFIDGIIIAATFLVSIPLGIVTALAVFAHEVPQEIGDFGLMLHKGLSRGKIIFVNVSSAMVSVIAAVVTFMLGNLLEPYIPILLSLTAGFFIYIATSDLIPEIHHEKNKKFALIKSGLLILGILVMGLFATLLEHGS